MGKPCITGIEIAVTIHGLATTSRTLLWRLVAGKARTACATALVASKTPHNLTGTTTGTADGGQ